MNSNNNTVANNNPTLINLTPHPLHVLSTNGEVVTIPPSGQSARVAVTQAPSSLDLGDFACTVPVFGDIIGLPDPQEGVVYVASFMVKDAAKAAGRTDVISPDSGPSAVRYTDADVEAGICPAASKGQIRYVRGFNA